MDRIADTLVLTFSWGMSLRGWRGMGTLSREWALYRALSSNYERIVLVTYGTHEEEQRIAAELPRHVGARPVEVVWNRDRLETAAWQAAVPELVGERLEGTRSAVVKTNQMSGGQVAAAIAEALRGRGIETGLVARGGYLWSRFVALRHGSESREALDAGAAEGLLCRAADVVVGTTGKMVEDLAWRYGVPMARCRTIPNYVMDSAPVRRVSDRERDTILCAGQLCERKGQDVLIRALAMIAERGEKPPRLEVIGEGPSEQEFRALATALNAPVDFLGPYEHGALLDRMSRCALFVQASSYEGHPKTILEAMATGAAVVVADAPGTSGVVEHGLTGIRVQRTPEAFAHVIEGLMEDPEWRDALGQRAAERTRAEFGLGAILPLECTAHREALARAGRGVCPGAPGVRWDAALLSAADAARLEAWSNSLHGFQKRLPAEERVRFLANLEQRVYVMEGEAARDAEGGLHPKHRYLKYHDWFAGRVAPGERVIDLGCGVGALAGAMARAGARVTGVDWDADTLERARTHAPGVELVAGDITACRVAGRFDTIVLSNVLEHIADRPQHLRQWLGWYGARRVLLRVPAFDREWRVPWKKELGLEWRLDTTHETEYTLEQLEDELRAAGLRIVEVTSRWGELWAEAHAVAAETEAA